MGKEGLLVATPFQMTKQEWSSIINTIIAQAKRVEVLGMHVEAL